MSEYRSIPSEKLPRIIYIMGSGRSGTTILEVLLSNSPGVAGVGEVTHIFRDGYINGDVCACGSDVSECELWSTVRRQCDWSDADISSGEKLFRRFSWHSKFPGVAMGLAPANAKKEFADLNGKLFSAVAKHSGAHTIIDSSKYAARAIALMRSFPDDVMIICLTRSPSGLMQAFSKPNKNEQKPKSTLATFIYYIYVMACFRVVSWRYGRRVLKIRYEDVVSDPCTALDRIERWSGVDLSATRETISSDGFLEPGHIVTGNRLRYQKKIRFRRSGEDRAALRMPTRIVVMIMNAYRFILQL